MLRKLRKKLAKQWKDIIKGKKRVLAFIFKPFVH